MEFILGIVVLVLDIWAIVSVLGSGSSGMSKLLWTIGIIVFPVVGFIVWYLAGPKGRAAMA
ncbi:hypothetical protein MB02_15270 [Croceicoccus estronivorus]|uniref:PLD nuclease N-terminal domain-containing protein n=1 Tax=Croceicoccus estronivorus TaxID=1172626 RepID=UPI0008331617|nr:PLD nuclease N-terminal domain-containing protein [Croceicoccus estronivorus]OCC22767.1 hypothetical protein MB02_15270 [Croceicoccus estronivorus]